MWNFNLIYRNTATVRQPTVLDLSFSVGVGVTDVTIDVTMPLSEFNYNHITQNKEIDGWVTDDSGTIVAFGVCTKIELDTEKETASLTFSGVPQLLRGAVLSNALNTNCEALKDGIGRVEIKASTKLGVLKNVIKYVADAYGGGFLPFRWAGTQQSGTSYLYALVNGDWLNLREMIDKYVDNENVGAFRFTYEPYKVGTTGEECAVDIAAISTQTRALEISTHDIRSIGKLTIDSSNTLASCFVLAPLEGANQGVTRHSLGRASSNHPNRCIGVIGGQKIIGTDAALQQDCTRLTGIGDDRCNQLPASSIDVTLNQTSNSGGSVFVPSDIGKIVSFPYILNGVHYYLFGVVSEARYKNIDTISARLSNVTLQTSDVLDYATMRRQTSTPKTTVNLLNTLSNNLGMQSVRGVAG